MDDTSYALRVANWQTRGRWSEETATLLDHAGARPGAKILDVGSNTGAMLRMVKERGATPVGVEVNLSAVRQSRETQPEVPIYPSIHDAALGEGRFDGIVMSHVICHVDDPEEMVYDALRSLKPGRPLVILTPNSIYDLAMAPANLFTGYRSDPTIKHSVRLCDIARWTAPHPMDHTYVGDFPFWLPSKLPNALRSRLMVITWAT